MALTTRIDCETGEVEVIEVPDEAAAAPEAVTMRQVRLALLAAGLLGQVDSALAALPSPQREAAQIEWEYAAEIRRDSPTMAMMGAALGLTDEEIDALFVDAAGR